MPGELNVADDVSRGIPAQQLTGRWKRGPEVLWLPTRNGLKKPQLLTGSLEVIDCKKFSGWRNFVRVTTYVLRFSWNVQT